MATSKTELINKALTKVGAAPITNIDEDSTNARVMNRVYETSLRSILSECKWNFATKRKLLSVVNDTVEWYETGETVAYQRPADIIRIFSTNDQNAIWREEGDLILSDTSGLGIRYVFFIDTPSKYPASFVSAFVDLLASDVAYQIVNSASLGENYKQLYEQVTLPKAMSENSQVGVQQHIQDDAWELAKYSNVSVNA
jgi:hypothetical protein